MKNSTHNSNLKKYIVDPLNRCLNAKLENFCYHDIFDSDNLTTNYQGVDIISHQLELKFESHNPIFISWATIDGWHQYSLCVSDMSFCKGVESFTKQDNKWKNIIGTKLKNFQVYGYTENVITSIENNSKKTTTEIYHSEPHLLTLEFENGNLLGIANFYSEDDFKPKLPMGDDIWIIFGLNYINEYVKNLSLEMLRD